MPHPGPLRYHLGCGRRGRSLRAHGRRFYNFDGLDAFTIELVVSDWATLIANRAVESEWEVFTTGFSFRPDPIGMPPVPGCSWPGWWCTDEKVAVVVDHDKPGDEAIRVRFEIDAALFGVRDDEYEVADFPLSELELEPGTLAALEGAGYTTFFDIIDLEREDFAGIEGVSEEQTDALLKVIEELTVVDDGTAEDGGPSEEEMEEVRQVAAEILGVDVASLGEDTGDKGPGGTEGAGGEENEDVA